MALNTKSLGLREVVQRWLMSKNMRRKVFRALSAEGLHVWRDFGDHSLVYDPSEAMGKMLDDYGHLNRDQTRAVIAEALVATGREGGVYLELGANIGTQTVYAMLDFGFERLVAVEPDPETFRVLSSNLRINDPGGRFTAVQVAVSDAPGTASLQRSRRNTGVSTLRTHALDEVNARPGGPDTLDSVEVRVVRTDDLLDEMGIAPEDVAFLWMDIEGFEPQALAGMPRLLAARPPLFMEYTPAWLSQEQKDTVEDALFAHYGSIRSHRDARPLDRAAFRALDQQEDLFALP